MHARNLDAYVVAGADGISGVAATEIDWLVGVGDAADLLSSYAEMLGDLLGRRGLGSAPTVWCSWNSYGAEIDQELIKKTALETAGEPFDVFLVDDGWQRAIGDWFPNDRFGDGMEDLASFVAGHDLIPGLWLSPFAVRSDQVDAMRDLLVLDSDGDPHVTGHNWSSSYHSLDLSEPEAVEFAAESVARAAEWGYQFLKLDFLFAGAVNPSDPQPEHTYRRAAERLRAAAGDDVRILACGAPILPSIGVFDAIRVGPDVAPYWQNPLDRYVQDYSAPGLRMAVSTSFARLWLGGVIDVDPDMSYFSMRRTLLDRGQQDLQRKLAIISGVKSSSALVADLTSEERETMRSFLDESHRVERIDRYRFEVDGEIVDFSSATFDRVSRLS